MGISPYHAPHGALRCLRISEMRYAKFGMAEFGAEKIWHQFLNTTENFWYQIPGLW